MTARKKLSLAIPTLNRAQFLDRTLFLLSSASKKLSSTGEIEIIVGDNQSSDNTFEIVRKWQTKIPNLLYFRHESFVNTAEASLIQTMQHVTGEYVWTLGDDDEPQESCLVDLLKYINQFQPDYIQLNTDYILPDGSIMKYLRTNSNVLEYDSIMGMFKDFGFCHITCAFYGCCFKNDLFNREIFKKFCSIAPIYSHMFALFSCFYNRKTIFINEPLIIGRINIPNEEFKRIIKASEKISDYKYFTWTIGLLKLINEVSKHTGIAVDQILDCNEPLVNRSRWIVRYTNLRSFIAGLCIEQEKLLSDSKLRDFKKEVLMLAPNIFQQNGFFRKNAAKAKDKLVIIGFKDRIVLKSVSVSQPTIPKEEFLAQNFEYIVTNCRSKLNYMLRNKVFRYIYREVYKYSPNIIRRILRKLAQL